MVRLDSSLEASGAEFLVLGHLLIEGIPAFKAYTNFAGYDIVATNPDRNTACRIQVKSRWATNFGGGFLIKNFDSDFVVFVALNRGHRSPRKTDEGGDGSMPPVFYVFPTAVVRDTQSPTSTWGKTFLRNIKDVETFVDAWHLIENFRPAAETAPVPSLPREVS